MLDLLEERAARAYPQKDAREIRLVLIDVISIMLFQILAPEFFNESESVLIADLAERYTATFARLIGLAGAFEQKGTV
jgi:hypothetical protein